ncbi:MAG: cytochrome c oxidase assembly protein [Candidatus Binatia bacterium]
MPFSGKNLLVTLLAAVLLLLPALYLLETRRDRAAEEPTHVLSRYLNFLYARDFRQAYRFISSADRQLKKPENYVRERGSFSGFTLEVARKLAASIRLKPIAEETSGNSKRVKLAMKLPDSNGVTALLLDWDEKSLNSLPPPEQKKILATIDRLAHDNQLPMIEGEEEYTLVKEGSQWKVFLNWAAGVHVNFATILPADGVLAAEPITKETVARSGDVFTIGFKVKNRARTEIRTRIGHHVEPNELAQYLDLVECALLLPVRIQPGEEQVYNSTYMIRGDLPDGVKNLNVTYEFKVEQ